jgi:hypothetical protein
VPVSDVLAVIFGITATCVGLAAVFATILTRDRRRYIGTYAHLSADKANTDLNEAVDPESLQFPAAASRNELHGPTIKFLELLPQIIHGHHVEQRGSPRRVENSGIESGDDG